MKSDDIVPAIRARLATALAAPAKNLIPLVVDSIAIGWLDADRARRLAAFDDVFARTDDHLRFRSVLSDTQARTGAADRVARVLADEGALSAWRDERYAIAPLFGAPALLHLERAAARYFGVRTYAVHINGLVRSGAGNAMWLGRRSLSKAIDPGMLDNMVGGGIAAGAPMRATAAKEAWEEAGITASLARAIQPAGAVHICRTQSDGLQRETIFVCDLWLDVDFVPANQDGEVTAFRRIALADVASVIATSVGDDVVTADASLVILDCLVRHGLIAPDSTDYLALDALRHPCLDMTSPRAKITPL